VSVRRKNVAGSVVAALVALSLAAMTSMATSAAAAASIVRFQGADRFATSAAIVQASYAPGVPVAYIATGLNFPDALAGGAAAAKAGGPLLLVLPDLIPTQIAAELTRLTPASIVVLGGTGAVSDAVLTSLQTYTSGSVTRVAGADRYATAANLAASFPTGSPVFIATGKDFPDALAGTAAAAAQHAAILLTTPTTIPSGTAAALSALAPSSITILGGTGAVSAAVATQLGAYTPTVTRLSGSDRYATAAAIATSAFPSATGVFITTGAGFADALTGGPVAGTAGQPLLLATLTCLPTATAAVVAADAPTTVTLLGGTGVLGAGVESLTTCASAATGATTRVSVASDGTQANNDSESAPSAISADGHYVAFGSSASNLVAGDTNGKWDVFVRDRDTGATTRVSVATDDTQADTDSYVAGISADGRYVAFVSLASNLVAGDTNGQRDLFVQDRVTGATTRVSVATDGTQANKNDGLQSAISADGRYVAFHSSASNLVAGDTNGTNDVFVHDRVTGATTRASVATDGTQANGHNFGVSISADGGYVAFDSLASNLVAGDTNGKWDVFVHDRDTGATTRVSVATDGTQANNESLGAISADGRFVAFGSLASNLVAGDTNGQRDVFMHDRDAGATTRVSVATDGTQGNGDSLQPMISADGRYVTFESVASNLVAGDTNGQRDVFVHDRVTRAITRVSVASSGTQGNGDSSVPAISADGRYVAFDSDASNLVAGDTNAKTDVFVRDRLVPALAAATRLSDFNRDGAA